MASLLRTAYRKRLKTPRVWTEIAEPPTLLPRSPSGHHSRS